MNDGLRLAVEESHRFLDGPYLKSGQGLHRNLLEQVDKITKEHSMTDEDSTPSELNSAQWARIEALKQAREILNRRPGPFANQPPFDVMDIRNLSVYILTGEDPWALDPVREAGCETATDAISAASSTGPGTATEAHRTDPEIAVNAVLDAVKIEVRKTVDAGMVPLARVLQAIDEARPDFDPFDEL